MPGRRNIRPPWDIVRVFDELALRVAHKHGVSAADLWRRIDVIERGAPAPPKGRAVRRSAPIVRARTEIVRLARRRIRYRELPSGREYVIDPQGGDWWPISTTDLARRLNLTHGAVVRLLQRAPRTGLSAEQAGTEGPH